MSDKTFYPAFGGSQFKPELQPMFNERSRVDEQAPLKALYGGKPSTEKKAYPCGAFGRK